jgi:exopolysaccharide biosynthesis protein
VRLRWTLPMRWQIQHVTHGLLAGPRLVEKGHLHVTALQEKLASLKSPDRMAIGVKPNGETILLWAHRRGTLDLSYSEVASVLTELGATDAIALDGGRSRAIFARPQADVASSERYFEGGRPVSNALVIAAKRSIVAPAKGTVVAAALP